MRLLRSSCGRTRFSQSRHAIHLHLATRGPMVLIRRRTRRGLTNSFAVQDDLNFSTMHLPEGEQPFVAITNPDDSDQPLACPYVLAGAGQSRWVSLCGANGGWI